MSPPLWRWAIEDDEPRTGSESELIRQLASGRLPPYALVFPGKHLIVVRPDPDEWGTQ